MRAEKNLWAVVYVNFSKTTIKESTSDGPLKNKLLQGKRRWSAPLEKKSRSSPLRRKEGQATPSWWGLSNLSMTFLLRFQEQLLCLRIHKGRPPSLNLIASPTNFVKISVC